MFFKDFRRIKKLGKYLTKDKKTIYLILIVLLPVSFSGDIQPLLVGQEITIRLTKSAMTPTAPLPKTSAKASTSFVNLVNNFPTGILS